ncbi:MAG: biopolymer transporter ExbD [Bacteroidetes bacterium]|nr:biopolymer transporter ExbD [Bacteroidota bacterium]
MAELDTSGGGHKKGPGVKKGKKLSTRVDLTPMVDLGFLLITFFMYTTTLAKPKTMEINMPYKDPNMKVEDQSKVKESTALTLLLSKGHMVYAYEGIGSDPTKPPELKPANISKSTKALREIILAKKEAVQNLVRSGALGPTDRITVLIKPDTTSTFKDLVDVFDEMTIDDVKVYAKVDITPQDREFIKLTEAGNPQAQ